jgi:hypothetical protein
MRKRTMLEITLYYPSRPNQRATDAAFCSVFNFLIFFVENISVKKKVMLRKQKDQNSMALALKEKLVKALKDSDFYAMHFNIF